MPTPDELRAAIADGRAALRSALEAAASGDWEKRPASGEGEAAWSARETAEHTVEIEALFATAVCTACGYPGVEFAKPSYATPAEAIAGLEAVTELTNKKLKYVSETDLEKVHDQWKRSAADIMGVNAHHLNDHAAQIRTAAGV
ncbi:MAG: DinB family protein [Dehalococcoidia bacterium]